MGDGMGGFRGVFPIEDGKGVGPEGEWGLENGDREWVCAGDWREAV